MKIILASKSPRRVELLSQMGFAFEQRTVEIPETIDYALPLEQIPMVIAEQKLDAIMPYIEQDTLVISADTLVFIGQEILGKPRDLDEAFQMLRKLSNNTHTVITGVCVWCKGKKVTFFDQTEVRFSELTDYEIMTYLTDDKVLDRAGAYGVQDWIGTVGIASIHGSYTNVMGLPTQKLYEVMRRFGLQADV
ncbi:MAG: septum formation protein Maf [Flavobacteriia bacterium]|nr:septum formation protein Maf [Flavobacteriia bacterium]